MNDKLRAHLPILDDLHNRPMNLYDAVRLHNIVDELTERDTYMSVHMKDGRVFKVNEATWPDNYNPDDSYTVKLNLDPHTGCTDGPMFTIHDEGEVNALDYYNATGIHLDITATIHVSSYDVAYAVLIPS
jgi:hypothetical protein